MVELPPPNLKRWDAFQKAKLVTAVWLHQITREEACHLYQISEAKILAWENAFKTYSYPGVPPGKFKGRPSDHQLPPADIKRWTPRDKAMVVLAVQHDQVTREEACRRYQLSAEELFAWEVKFKTDGTAALRTTRVQQYRRLSLPKTVDR